MGGTPAAPTVRYVVPWRTDNGQRHRIWTFCRAWWSPLPITEAASPAGPFNRAAAINGAASGEWDVLVVMDADVLAPLVQVTAAVDRAMTTGMFTRAYESYVPLSTQETTTVLDTGAPPWTFIRRPRTIRHAHASSILAIPRGLFDALGGFDERFVGWGQEDVSFAHAARLIGGWHESIEGRVWHLDHPKSPGRDRHTETWRANKDLGARYRRTRTAADVAVLLDEWRALRDGTDRDPDPLAWR